MKPVTDIGLGSGDGEHELTRKQVRDLILKADALSRT